MAASSPAAGVAAQGAEQVDLRHQAIDLAASLTQSPIGNALLIVAAVVIVTGAAAIFNTLLLNTRERARDTATLKTVGMSPRQVMVMVAASAALLALVGGVIGVPAWFGLNTLLVSLINDIGNNDTPAAMYEVFRVWSCWRYRWPGWPSPWRRRCCPCAGRRTPA